MSGRRNYSWSSFAGLRGTLSVTFEEGTWAAWLYDLLKPHVAKLVVSNPRKNALLKHGNKSDKIDARKLADLLRLNDLEPVVPKTLTG
jgi:transposase